MKWFSRKLVAGLVAGVGLILTGQADQLPTLAITYIGAQGAVDVTKNFKKKEN